MTASVSKGSTVRVDSKTRDSLTALSKETGAAKNQIVAEAVERMRRARILDASVAGFAALRADRGAWAEEQKERALWDGTLGDGLEGAE